MAGKKTAEVMARAEDTLYTAYLGLDHLKGADPRARIAGLRNVIVFGRAVTNVLQNLRSNEREFDAWYGDRVSQMESDPLMRFLYRLRSEVLKEGTLAVSSSMTLTGDPMAVFRHFKAPPRAKSFFIGDQIGGSGWEVETDTGAIEKYYVQLPGTLPGLRVDMNIHFVDAPDNLRDIPAATLCEKYLGYLSQMVQDARAKFR